MMNLIKCEMDKIIQRKSFVGGLIVSLIVLAGIIFIGFYYSQLNISGEEVGEGTELYHEVVKESTGDFTDQQVKSILANYIDRYQSENKPFDLYSWQIGEVFFLNDKDIYLQMNEAMAKDEQVTMDEIELKTINEIGFSEFDKPLKIGSYVTWYDLYQVTNQLFLLISVITILICSLVFSGDTSRNMNQLLLSTKFGRSKLTISKIVASTLLSSVVFLFIHIISLVSFYVYNSGFEGWDSSIQTNFSLKLFSFPVELNHFQVFLSFIALHFISMLSIIGITLYVSSLTRSPFSSLIISIGLFLLPKALTEFFKRGVVYKSLNLLPVNNYSIEDFLSLLSSKHDFLLNHFVQNLVFVMIVLLVIKITLDILVYLRMKKYQVT
ncbi:ABC transporter permease [Rossellomorea aquimaris]|uniref:ABC transporter permease subunit n=1 Tax=Rossellomorea aquimaris TaxID=189382 RepID=A0A5D4U3P2_9BACI|nr:ABC transporter permease subunit [Rossellomorea aquimaris]TYS81689.1 ABC transporter permease subunit [Rossellomorea aquimaris]TYS88314.1 ABC transporter permease subunit [Rossellomorea aquimaris]